MWPCSASPALLPSQPTGVFVVGLTTPSRRTGCSPDLALDVRLIEDAELEVRDDLVLANPHAWLAHIVRKAGA